MSESREVLIDAMSDASGMPAQTEVFAACLDALLAHPVAVLSLLENAKCPNPRCDEGQVEVYGRSGDFYEFVTCSACGGSGKLGRDGVLRLLGPLSDAELLTVADQAGWVHLGAAIPYFATDPSSQRAATAVFKARPVPVPEPSEGETP